MFTKKAKATKIKNIFFEYFSLIKNIFLDVFILYRNFFHWNISKITIKVFTFVLGIIMGTPFIIVMIIFCFIDPINWLELINGLTESQNISLKLVSSISMHPFYVLLELLLLVFSFVFFTFGITYSLPLESNLYLNYLKGNKIGFLSNHYFNIDYIKRYIFIVLRIISYLFIPVALFLVIFIFFLIVLKTFGFYELKDSLIFNTFSVILFLIFIFCIGLFIYISYRLTFVNTIFIDNDEYKEKSKSKFYVKESISLTKGFGFFKFLGIIILFSIIFLPFESINDALNRKGTEMRNYLGYKYGLLDTEENTDRLYYDILKREYGERDDIDIKDDISYNYIYRILYYMFSFMFISGVINMMVVSFYFNELKKKTKKRGILEKLKL